MTTASKVHFYDRLRLGLPYISWDWATCPNPNCDGWSKVHANHSVEAEVLSCSAGRPRRNCRVCIYTCEHVVYTKKYKCWYCDHIWTQDVEYP